MMERNDQPKEARAGSMPCEENEHFCNLTWVTAIQVLDNYQLHLTFNDGSQRIFDCLPLIEHYKLFAPLRDKTVFACVALDGWTVSWLNGSIDIAPEHLYEMGQVA